MLGTADTVIILTHIAGIIWKVHLTGGRQTQQSAATDSAQLSTTMLLCLSNSHYVAAEFTGQQKHIATRKEHASQSVCKAHPSFSSVPVHVSFRRDLGSQLCKIDSQVLLVTLQATPGDEFAKLAGPRDVCTAEVLQSCMNRQRPES